MQRLRTVLAALASLAFAAAAIAQPPDVEHHIVYSTPHEFTGHPANEGMWQWGDEVLVGFNITLFSDRDDTHARADGAPRWSTFARSLDGGRTWTHEPHPEISRPARLKESGEYVRDPVSAYPPIPKARPFTGAMDFTHPDFALRVRNSEFYYSTNRGRHWDGPYALPDLGVPGVKDINARTNYLVVDSRTCRVFLSVDYDSGNGVLSGRTMMVETTDGGRTFQFVSWLAGDPLEGVAERKGRAFAIMPGVLTLDDGSILATVRWTVNRVRWVEVIQSTDDGRTWQKLARFEDVHNPVGLVKIDGSRIAAIYGWRNAPYGIYARITGDNGVTWGEPIALRDDARNWDIGYPRVATLPDGRILITYYYTTTERPANHIAATIWNPAGTGRH